MILLLSNDGDLSVDIVQDWLEFYHHPYIRFNSWQFLTQRVQISLENGKVRVYIEGKEVELNSVGAIWFRKYGLFRCSDTYRNICNTKKLNEELVNHLTKEYMKVVETFFADLRDRNWLTNPNYININKFEMLKIASECGLKTVNTYIVNSREDLVFGERVISKSVLDPIIASWNNSNKSMMYTVELKGTDIENMPSHFMPSMLQYHIEKEYELRVFYLCGKTYSMAIFSQNDKQTQLDFRNYNWDKPNRMVPCLIDKSIESGICKLMERLNLNTGSLDFIKSKDGNTYFLEVNPTGQFGMVDFPCNYGLHKEVALKLIEMDNLYEKSRKTI